MIDCIYQVKAIKRSGSALSQPVTIGNVAEFSWEDLVEDTEKIMPLSISCISAMMPSVKGAKRGRTKGKKGSRRYNM